MKNCLKHLIGVSLMSLACAGSAGATSLNLSYPSSPDIFASGLSLSYTASSGVLNMSGDVSLFTFLNQPPYTIQYTPDTNSPNYGGVGKFALSAVVDSSGNATSGTFSVGGFIAGITGSTLPGNGNAGGDALDFSLLTGNLLQFGFQPSPDGKLEFVFQVTGGDLAPLYGPNALMVFNQFGDPTDTGIGFPGTFEADFTTGDPNEVAQYGWAISALCRSQAVSSCSRPPSACWPWGGINGPCVKP